MKIYLSNDAVKFLKKLEKSNKSEKEKILRKIRLLNIDPFLGKKLKGAEWFSMRVGEYRVIYEIHTDIGEIWVLKIDKRSKIYKNL